MIFQAGFSYFPLKEVGNTGRWRHVLETLCFMWKRKYFVWASKRILKCEFWTISSAWLVFLRSQMQTWCYVYMDRRNAWKDCMNHYNLSLCPHWMQKMPCLVGFIALVSSRQDHRLYKSRPGLTTWEGVQCCQIGRVADWASFDRLGPENNALRVDQIWAAFKKLKTAQSAAFFFTFILVTLS